MLKLCSILLIFAAFSVNAFPRFHGGNSESDVTGLRLRRQANPPKGKPNQNQPPPPPQNQGGGQNGGNRPPPPPPPQGNGNPPRPTPNPGNNCQNGSNPPPPPPPRGNGRSGRRPPPPPPPRGGHGHSGCNSYPETTSQPPEEVTSVFPLEVTTNVSEVSPTYDPIVVGNSTDSNVITSDPVDYSLNPVTADGGTTTVYVLPGGQTTSNSIEDGTTISPAEVFTTSSPLEGQTVSGT
uniref:Basic proline-rich protein n=1 Tax=Panagrellus redivivus TaxID=6233 RepID=A0A7E4V699_PANRE